MYFEPTVPRKRTPRGTLDRAQAVATTATITNSDTHTARGIGTGLGATRGFVTDAYGLHFKESS
ncbi:hypothetical protein EHYA_05571 [Embleya hyalina]|uniref:Uncharacterized protein n=1 Tax=Embleya hyalina TaxID=516124 RepID=A0A401YTF3_9ACTN|nr:hypothetical protein EHYA_05571 [Embleya hyalina]